MDKTIHVEKVPEEMWRKFKGYCAMRGTTMREQIITLIERWLEEQEKGKR